VEQAHSVSVRVFCGEEENEKEVIEGLKWLIPLNLEEEKISLTCQTAFGFSDRRIKIFEVVLEKKRHINAFFESLLPKISDQQKQMMVKQLDTRIDANANFFIRFDKPTLLQHRELIVTDSGNCFHLKIKIAAFPSTKEKAKAIVGQMLGSFV
jgi:RNA-binding protein